MVVNSGSSADEFRHILSNLCASYKEWHNSVMRPSRHQLKVLRPAIIDQQDGNLDFDGEKLNYDFPSWPIEPEFAENNVFESEIPHPQPPLKKKDHVRAVSTSEPCLFRGEAMVKIHHVPKFGSPFHPVLSARPCTRPQPFSFDDKIRETLAKKEKMFKMILAEEAKAREFFASPVPDLSSVLPKRKSIPVTSPFPFKLLVDERAANRFDAARTPVEPGPFHQEMEEQNARRTKWRLWKKEKEEAEALRRQEEERRRKEEEEAEVQRIRREAVHQANSIRRYRSMGARENIPLTRPCSPDFSERLKRQKLCC